MSYTKRRQLAMQNNVASALSYLNNGVLFSAPLRGTVALQQGYGAPSFTRATTATQEDHEQKLNLALSGEVRFTGHRRVRNLLPTTSEDLSNAAWTKSSATVLSSNNTDPLGTTTACAVDFGASAASYFQITIPTQTPGTVVYSFWAKADAETTVRPRATNNGSSVLSAALTIGTSWQRFSIPRTSSGTGLTAIGINNNAAGNSGVIYFAFHQAENVTGQSNQNPAEYVSVGAAKLNMLLDTENLSTTNWNDAATAITRTANAATAPNGVASATSWAGDGTVAVHYSGQAVTLSAQKTYELSFYAKSNGVDYLQVIAVAGTGYANFDLSTGVIGTNLGQFTNLSIESVGDGWYLCSCSIATPVASSIYFVLSNSASATRASASFATSDGVYLWGTMLRENTVTGDYFPVGNVYPYHGCCVDGVKYFTTENGNTVASNVVTEALGAPIPESTLKGYLAEGARTNICLQSADFATTWARARADVAAFSTAAPDGTSASDEIEANATNAAGAYVSQSFTLTASTAYTFSVFAHAGTTNFLAFNVRDGTNIRRVWFNLATGAVGSTTNTGTGFTATSQSVTAYPDGWVRCSVTLTIALITSVSVDFIVCDADNSIAVTIGANIGLWGAQLEAGSFASSYIPTTTASVTRNADVLTYQITGNLDSTVGSAYLEFTSGVTSGTTARFISSNGSTTTPLYIDNSPAAISLFDGTTERNFNAVTLPTTAINKAATSWGGSSSQGALNGTAATAAGFDGDLGVATAIGIGCGNSGTTQPFGTLKNVRILLPQFSAAQLQIGTNG